MSNSGEARSAEMYVLHYGKFVEGVSFAIETAMARGQESLKHRSDVGEIEWEPDAIQGAKVLRLKYKNKRTGRWNTTPQYISTVPLLDSDEKAGQARSAE